MPDFAHFNAIDGHLDQQIARIDERARFAIGLPHDVRTCTALLLFADTLTHGTHPDALPSELVPPLPAKFRQRAAHLVRSASPGLRSALSRLREPLVRTRQGRVGAYAQESNRTGDFEPRHAPQRLPDHWLAELHDLANPLGLHLQRDAAIRLIQTVHDTSRLQAGQFLGLPANSALAAGVHVTSWLRDGGKAAQYAQAVSRIADRLTTEPLIDYRHRREALHDWALPEADWNLLVADIIRNRSTSWTSEEHLTGTIYIWAQITSSEPRLHPVCLQVPSGRSRALVHIWNVIQRPTPQLRELRTALDHYSHHLATQLLRTGTAQPGSRAGHLRSDCPVPPNFEHAPSELDRSATVPGHVSCHLDTLVVTAGVLAQ
ncbi:hypothetical protein ACIRST_32715 [Kitasatospora sp. NPDC101447]|uniref:hypothetical protein n=1 Tax=Kitasatospora sp. NPDC101447 TaxID=3364102 RepID=UPI003804DEDC